MSKKTILKIRKAFELRDVLKKEDNKVFDTVYLDICFPSFILNEFLKNVHTSSTGLLSNLFHFNNEILRELENENHRKEMNRIFEDIALHLKESPQLNSFDLDREDITVYNLLLDYFVFAEIDVCDEDRVYTDGIKHDLLCFRSIAEMKGDEVLQRYLTKITTKL